MIKVFQHQVILLSIREMVLIAIVLMTMQAGEQVIPVTEFVPLHDIPYIFLSPDRAPYLSIDEFLAAPDRHLDLSAFIPGPSLS